MDFSSIWNGVSNFATNAFSWIGDNPEAANLIGGVALGAAQGYMADKTARDERVFKEKQWDKEREARYAKPGEIQDYDSHVNQIADGGLIANGMISGRKK